MSSKLSRRQLGIAVLSSAASAQTKYKGPLDGSESKVTASSFDPVYWTKKRHESAPLRMTFNATNRKQVEAWQKRLRPRIAELLGGLPVDRRPTEAQTLEVVEQPTYRREKLVFESRPGVSVLAYLVTPKNVAPPYATMICVPGHGLGVDDIVGIDPNGKIRTVKQGYAYDFGLQAVENGMAAIAIEPMAFGCRRDEITKKKSPTANACQPAAGSALLLGETMLGWRVHDVIRTVDWIETRKELDAKRIGCVGISGGGTCTLFSAALEPRIRVAFVSCYLNTFRDSIMSMSHCIDNYVPGILQWCEMYDVAGLIAPRPLFVESGDKDPIFPIEASKASFARVKTMYEAMGAGKETEQEIFDGPHMFHGVRGLPFCARKLGVIAKA